LLVAPGNADVPLKARTDAANKAKANLYVSVHANALNGQWGNQQGVATYYYPGSVVSQKVATAIHNRLKAGTVQKNRGVLTADFFVLRETKKIPAVLVECAFMDNLREAKLLMSDSFRQECADQICQGICDYFKVKYVPMKGGK
jgi:N-acetylmuramoyl-L-alanine amidase